MRFLGKIYEKKFSKTLLAIEELEHYLAESQLYGLNMVSITTTQEMIANIKNSLLEEGSEFDTPRE
jgi:hypothetical protein